MIRYEPTLTDVYLSLQTPTRHDTCLPDLFVRWCDPVFYLRAHQDQGLAGPGKYTGSQEVRTCKVPTHGSIASLQSGERIGTLSVESLREFTKLFMLAS